MKKLFSLLIVFMAIFTIKVKAASENINITDVKVIDKSSTITVEDPVLVDNKISSSVKFNKINDFVIYEVSFENKDSYDYTVDKIVDNNTSSNLSIEYDYSEQLLKNGTGTLRIKLTYKNQLLNVEKITLSNLEVTMNLTKSDGTKTEVKISNPTTGDNIGKYVFILTISVVGIVLTKKNIKVKGYKVGKLLLVLPFLVLPFAIFAAERFEINIKFSDVEVKGEFEVYDIEFGDDTKKVTYGQPIGELPEVPEKNGYDSVGWVDENGNEITEDTVITSPITVSPKYKAKNYSITYNLGNGEADNEVTYTIEDEITLTNPTRAGYTFAGWTGFNGENLQTRVTIPKGTTGNISFTANWSVNQNTKYKVVHRYPNLDNTYEEVTENLEGATDTEITPALRNQEGFTGPNQLTTTTINGDESTTVTYTYTRNQYRINLDSPYITTTSTTKDYYYGEQITVSAIDREGYNFTGWSNGDTNREITITVEEPLTVTPNYEIIKHTVTFNPNEGLVGEESRKVNYNTKIGDLPVPTNVGYAFLGWFNGDNEVDKNFKPTSDTTLTAHWIKSIDNITITNNNITLDINENETINITGNEDVEELTFTSNNTNVVTVNSNGQVTAVGSGSTTITITGTVSGNTKTVNVTVNSQTYTVTFDPVDGQVTTESISVDVGETINSFPQADLDGYTFIGWFNGDNEITTPYTPTSDITLTAHYEESNELVHYTDSDNDGTISLGDYVQIGNDGFYVIGTEGSQVKLLPQYNLDSNSRQSENDSLDIQFSNTDYWMTQDECSAATSSSSSSSSSSGSECYSEEYIDSDNYSNYGDYYYIYRDSNDNDADNNLKSYVNNYKDYLTNDVGIEVIDARLMSYEETRETGCTTSSNSCPTWVANQYYWLGSAYDNNYVWYVDSYDRYLGGYYYNSYSSYGVRPVVIVEASAIIKSTVRFDSQGGSSVASMKVATGEQVGRLPNSHKDDKVLAGWYTDTNYTTQVTASTTVTGNVTYYAKWVTPTGLDYTDSDNSSSINLGDSVKIGDDEFYVIDAPSDGKVKLLAKYNLNSSYRQASSDYANLDFSDTNYWWDSTNSVVKNEYTKDTYNYAYIYRDKDNNETNNNLKTYINNYKDYLVSLGATNIEDARLMSYEEARGTGCNSSDNSCPTWVANQYYWLGSAVVNGLVWNVDSFYRFLRNSYYSRSYGVRPVVIVEASAIEFASSHNKITFDYQYNSQTEIRNIEVGSALTTLPEPTWENGTFEGWYTDTNYTTEVTSETVPTESTTYYAKWTADIAYTDSDNSSSINLGDSVKIGDDEFYVIESPSNGKVKLLAKYNLNSSYRQASSDYASLTFSDTNYWWDNTSNVVKSNYTKDTYNYAYIYRDKDNNETNNNLKTYINNYKDYLVSLGATNIEDARLMSYEETRGTGCKNGINNSCPTWVANQYYWLGSANVNNYVWYVHSDFRRLDDDSYFYNYGVRPVVIISESSISTP